MITSFRSDVFKTTEELRTKNSIKQSIEAKIILKIGNNSKYHFIINTLKKELGIQYIEILCQLLIVSDICIESLPDLSIHMTINNTTYCQESCTKECNNNYKIIAEKHTGKKCERCWKYFYHLTDEIICNRCQEAIQ